MRIFLVILLISAPYFLPGIRVGSVPIPTIFLLCGLYLTAFQPRIPEEYFKPFLLVLSYMLLFSLRNSMLPTGGAREFLYLLLVVGHFTIFVTFYDLFKKGHGQQIVRLLLLFSAFEMLLMVAQSINLGGINQAFSQLFLYYLEISDSETFLPTINERPFGTMSNSMLAGMTAYLALRAVSVYTGKRGYVYLALPIILLSVSRMALGIFVFYELIVPLLLRSGRLRSLIILLTLGGFAAAVALLFGDILVNLYAFKFLHEIQQGHLSENFSLINRLNSYLWAYQKLDQFLFLGGVTTQEFSARQFGVDSEFVLRSLQFGFLGYLLMIWVSFSIASKTKGYDTYFILFFMVSGSLSNTVASNFLLMPFVAIYVCALRAVNEQRGMRHALAWQRQQTNPPTATTEKI